jgi:hypothetical protein
VWVREGWRTHQYKDSSATILFNWSTRTEKAEGGRRGERARVRAEAGNGREERGKKVEETQSSGASSAVLYGFVP